MLLAPDDAALFYRAWGAILVWVNQERRVVPPFPPPTPEHPIAPPTANELRKVLWADDSLRDRFLADGAAGLAGAERELIASWRHRLSGNFIVLRHLKRHSILLKSNTAYAVLGLYTPLALMLPHVPMYVTATLLPFRDKTITDGLIESPGMHLSFGGGARRMFNDEYSEARSLGRVVTSLPASQPTAASLDPPLLALAATAERKRKRAPRRR